jgi:hypothetical protein
MIQNKSKLSVVESAWEAWRNSQPTRQTIEAMKAEGWLPRLELAKQLGRSPDKMSPAWGERAGLETTTTRIRQGETVTQVRFFRPKNTAPV